MYRPGEPLLFLGWWATLVLTMDGLLEVVPMIQCVIEGNVAVFEIRGQEEFWTIATRIEVPLEHITKVSLGQGVDRQVWHGVQSPAMRVRGPIATGSLYRTGRRTFWDVADGDRALVVDLRSPSGAKHQLIVEVDRGQEAMALLQQAVERLGEGKEE